MNDINFHPFPEIETENLILRRLLQDDVNEIFSIRSNESIGKYLDRPLCKNIEEAHNFIKIINDGIEKCECFYWAITQKGKGKLIGTICLWQISREESKAEIGFELLPDYQKKGIMKEAAPEIIKFGFEVMGLIIIEGEVAPGNLSSIKIMEKNGFKLKPNNSEKNDTVIYVLNKQDYKI